MSGERTRNSLRNSTYALVFYVLNLALTFLSRRVFIDHIGAELMGLGTTVGTILEMLNLAELGLGAATTAVLYKPLHDGDRGAVAELMTLQGWFYRRVTVVVLTVSAALLPFFPQIFADMEAPTWYAYVTFAAFLPWPLASYMFNYKQILLSADQKEYRVTQVYKLPVLVKTVIQMVAVVLLPMGYIWWLAIHVGYTAYATIVMRRTVRREYPWLADSELSGRELMKRHPGVLTKTRQLIIHRIAAVALRNSAYLGILAYIDLETVTSYGNYMMIVTGLAMLDDAVFSGLQGSVGDMIAQGDRRKTASIFWELFSIKFYIGSVFTFGMLLLSGRFIELWIGPGYGLSATAERLIVAIMFINVTRSIVDQFIAAKGQYGDIWAPAVEASLNIGLSLTLGRHYGLEGILAGVLTSLILVVVIWKPYYLIRRGGLKLTESGDSLRQYWVTYLKHTILATGSGVTVWGMTRLLPEMGDWDACRLMTYAVMTVGVYVVLLAVVSYMTSEGSRTFIQRAANMIRDKRAK